MTHGETLALTALLTALGCFMWMWFGLPNPLLAIMHL